MLDDVRAWLERGGYVLEIEATDRLSRLGPALVEQAYHYKDPITGADREGDVRAFYLIRGEENEEHGVTVFVECKDTTAPWVFFVGGQSAEHRTPLMATDRANCPYCWLLDRRVYAEIGSSVDAYAVTEKRTKENSKDHAYIAVQQAASALVAEYGSGRDVGHEEHTFASFGYAIVVTRSPLVVCGLDIHGKIHLAETRTATVIVPRLDLPDTDAGQGIAVTVVHLDSIDDVLGPLLAPFDPTEVEDAVEVLQRLRGAQSPADDAPS